MTRPTRPGPAPSPALGHWPRPRSPGPRPPHSTPLLGTWPGPGGLTLSTFSRPKSEAPGDCGEGGGRQTPRPGLPLPARGSGGSQVARVLQLCIHYKLKTLSPHSCSSALPGLTTESRSRFPPGPAVATVATGTSVLPSAVWSPITSPVTVSGEQMPCPLSLCRPSPVLSLKARGLQPPRPKAPASPSPWTRGARVLLSVPHAQTRCAHADTAPTRCLDAPRGTAQRERERGAGAEGARHRPATLAPAHPETPDLGEQCRGGGPLPAAPAVLEASF